MRNGSVVSVVLLCYLTAQTSAVLIASGDGTGNTTAPADDPGFDNVGIVGSGTAVYLGFGWVLTASHVGAGSTLFNNVWYSEVPGSAVQLANPSGDGFTPYSDLTMYRIQNPPSLLPTEIAWNAATPGTEVTMIGNGRDRSSSQEAYWTSTWAPSSTPSAYAGYIWASTNDIRWGTAVISAGGLAEGIGANSETSFATSFLANSTPYEAQGTPGDSGGGVFAKDPTTGVWTLAGTMFAVSSEPGQPWGVSVFGDSTFSADLSPYRDEIYQTMGVPNIVNGQFIASIASKWSQPNSGVNGQYIAWAAAHWMDGSSVNTGNAVAVPEPGRRRRARWGPR